MGRDRERWSERRQWALGGTVMSARLAAFSLPSPSASRDAAARWQSRIRRRRRSTSAPLVLAARPALRQGRRRRRREHAHQGRARPREGGEPMTWSSTSRRRSGASPPADITRRRRAGSTTSLNHLRDRFVSTKIAIASSRRGLILSSYIPLFVVPGPDGRASDKALRRRSERRARGGETSRRSPPSSTEGGRRARTPPRARAAPGEDAVSCPSRRAGAREAGRPFVEHPTVRSPRSSRGIARHAETVA